MKEHERETNAMIVSKHRCTCFFRRAFGVGMVCGIKYFGLIAETRVGRSRMIEAFLD